MTFRYGRFLPVAFLLALCIHASVIFWWKPFDAEFSLTGEPPGLDTGMEVELADMNTFEESSQNAIIEPLVVNEEEIEENYPDEEEIAEEKEEAPDESQPTPAESPTPVKEIKIPVQHEQPKPQQRLSSIPKPRNTGTHASALSGTSAVSSKASLTKPGYLRNPQPAYPAIAKQNGYEGVTVLRVEIDRNGSVTSVRIERSSGHTILDEQARQTVKSRWRFRPAKQNGLTIPAEILVPIRFQLR